MSLHAVCPVADLPPGDVRRVETEPPIAVFNVDGIFWATDDTCTHEEFALSDGFLEGDVVECSLHLAKFCVRTGEALSLPATKPLRTYPVTIEGGVILVDTTERTLYEDGAAGNECGARRASP